jgi:hypothetical protein
MSSYNGHDVDVTGTTELPQVIYDRGDASTGQGMTGVEIVNTASDAFEVKVTADGWADDDSYATLTAGESMTVRPPDHLAIKQILVRKSAGSPKVGWRRVA